MIKLESVTYPPVALHIKGFTGSKLKPDTITIANGEDGIPVKYILAAEERGVAALQSGEAPSQQLKPKMPGFLAVIEHVEGVYGVLSEREGQIVSRTREFISRHFGH